jgi:hypothetical protein
MMSGACRLSRPCAAGEPKGTAPLLAVDPAVLDAEAPGIGSPPRARGLGFAASPVSSGRAASPPVPPPRA